MNARSANAIRLMGGGYGGATERRDKWFGWLVSQMAQSYFDLRSLDPSSILPRDTGVARRSVALDNQAIEGRRRFRSGFASSRRRSRGCRSRSA